MRERKPESEDRQSQIKETDPSAEIDQPAQQEKELDALRRARHRSKPPG